MDGKVLVGVDGATLIDGLTNNVDDSAESCVTDGNLNWRVSVSDGLTANEAFGGVKSDGAHVVTTQVLGDLEDETVLSALNFERIHDGRQGAFELDVDNGTNNLGNLS